MIYKFPFVINVIIFFNLIWLKSKQHLKLGTQIFVKGFRFMHFIRTVNNN